MIINNICINIGPDGQGRNQMLVRVRTNIDSFCYNIQFNENDFESRFHQMMREAELAIMENLIKETKDDDDIV